MKGLIKKTTIFSLLIFTSIVWAESTVQKLQSIKTKYLQVIEQFRYDDSESYEITLNNVYPGTGFHTKNIQFLYNSYQVDPQTDPYLTDKKLQMVIVEYNLSNYFNYRIEILFNNAERVQFYYWQEESIISGANPAKKRFYFDNIGYLLFVEMDYLDESGDRIFYTRDNSFSQENQEMAYQIQTEAEKYLTLFHTLNEF